MHVGVGNSGHGHGLSWLRKQLDTQAERKAGGIPHRKTSDSE